MIRAESFTTSPPQQSRPVSNAESDGETIVWSDQTPAADAKDPVLTLLISRADDQTVLTEAKLLLYVDGAGYKLGDDALSVN